MKPKTIKETLALAGQRLTAAGCDTPGLDAELLLAHSLDKDRTWLYTHFSTRLEPNELNKFGQLLGRREQREPVAYMTGVKEFFGLEFHVNRQVLIPRPETEILVETALEIAHPPLTIADVGTGSGCVAITLAKNLEQATIFAIDLSEKALALARQNGLRQTVADRVTFLAGNLLEPLIQPVDLIVSNPPYLSQVDMATVAPEISRYEPYQALAGGPDGLAVIRQLLFQARQKLNAGGTVLVEIGANQGEAVAQLARTDFPQATIELKQDLAGHDRVLVVKTGLPLRIA